MTIEIEEEKTLRLTPDEQRAIQDLYSIMTALKMDVNDVWDLVSDIANWEYWDKKNISSHNFNIEIEIY